MKSPYVNEIAPDQTITGSFLVHSKEIRQKKTGDPYLSLLVGDRTGDLDAKMWDNVAEVMETFECDDFVKIKGLLQIFHNRPQLTVHKIRPLKDNEVDFTDYFPASTRDPEEMWRELRQFVADIGNPHLRRLLDALLDDEEIARRFRIAPAAKQIHHAYLGGLIEHVLSLCHLARMTAGHYRNIDVDLLISGAVLHDIGKIHELSYDRSFGYSAEGQLLGHMLLGVRMVDQKLCLMPEFPPRLRSLVEHMIISHHGRLEFGSPKVPAFPEAMLLHYLDDMDSKMECMRHLLETDRLVDGCFTGYNASLERVLLKKDKYLGGGEREAPAATSAPSRAERARPQPAPADRSAETSKITSTFASKLLQALHPADRKLGG